MTMPDINAEMLLGRDGVRFRKPYVKRNDPGLHAEPEKEEEEDGGLSAVRQCGSDRVQRVEIE